METSKKPLGSFTIFLIASLTTLLIVLAITPSFLSTALGTRFLCFMIEKRSNISVAIEDLHLGWLTEQSAKKITAIDKNQALSVVSKDIHNSSSLLSMFFKDDHVGLTQIDDCAILLKSKTSSEKNTENPKKKTQKISSLPLLQNIFIRDGSIRLDKEDAPSSINHFQLSLQLRHDKMIVSSKGSSLAKEVEGFFDIFCSANLLNFDIEGRLNTSNFPFAIFDELLSLNGFLEKTLGPTLNANSAFHLTDDKLSCSLEMLSSLFKASIHTSHSSENVFLEKPSVVSLTLTKESMQAFSEHSPYLDNIYLSQAGSLQLFIDELKVPYLKKTLDFEKASYKARLFTSSLHLINKQTQKPLIINASTLASSSDQLASSILLTLKSSLNYNLKNPSFVSGSAIISSPLKSAHLTNLQAKITKLPTIILETFSAQSLDFIDLIGENLDLTIATKTPGDAPTFTFEVHSPLVSIEPLDLAVSQDGLSIINPFHINYKTPKKPLKDFLAKHQISLLELGTTRLTIEQAKLSKEGFSKEGLHALSLKGSLQTEDIVLNSSYLLGKCKLKHSKLDFTAPSLKKVELKTSAALSFIDNHSHQQDLFGSTLPFTALAVVEKLSKKNLAIPYLNISSANERTSLELSCSFTENLRKFSFLEPLSLNFNLNPELFNKLFSVSSAKTAFLFPAPLKLHLNADPFYLSERFSKKLKIDSTLSIPHIKILDKLYGREFDIENTQFIVKADANQGLLQGQLSSAIRPSDVTQTTGTLSCEVVSNSFTSLDFIEKPWSIKGSAYRIPSSLFDVAFDLNATFATLIGLEFTSNFSALVENPLIKMSGDFKSQNVIFGLNLSKTKDMLTIDAPIQGSLILEKDSYSALESLFAKDVVSKQTFALNKPAAINFNINQLQWLTRNHQTLQGSLIDRFFGFINEHLKRSLLDVTLQSQEIDLICQENSKTATLKNLSVDCKKAEGLTPFVMNIRSDVSAKQQKDLVTDGHIISTVMLQTITNSSKQNMLSTKIEGSLSQVPTMIMDMVFQASNLGNISPSVILGNSFSSSFTAKFENSRGSLDADIKAEQAEGDLHAYTQNGVLKLSKPLKAKVNITPLLVEFFFKNMNLNITQASAPLTLFIDNRGFYIPFDPYDFQSIQIRKGSINLGQITCSNTGNPQEIGSFFKLNLKSQEPLNLWFTPLEFSLSNGIMYIDRTEILYNKAFEIALWGKLDIEKNFAQMTLGLTEQSLRKALGVKGLPRSFVLQLPIEGPIDNVQINKEIAVTRLALFLAKTSGATNYGGLWGGIASALSDFANDQTMVPPAKPPYPWEGKLSSYEQEHKNQDTVHIIR